MSLVGQRNIQDASLNPSTFVLPSAAGGNTTSAVIDLGADNFKSGEVDVCLEVPALSSTIAPSAATAGVTFAIESSTTSAFSAVARTIVSKNVAGSLTGIAAQELRTRVPGNCERYIRAKVTIGTTTTDASAVSGTLTLRF